MRDKEGTQAYTKNDFVHLAALIRERVLAMDGVASIRGNVWERVKDSFSRHRRRSFDGIVLVETDGDFLVAISVIAHYGVVLPMLSARIQDELKFLCRSGGVVKRVSVSVFIDNVVVMEKK